MNAVWVDEGSSLNVAKCRQHGIDAPYFSHRFGNATKDILQAAKDDGFKPGIYSAWNWFLDLDGPGYAQKLSDDLKTIVGTVRKGNPIFDAPVCVDIESGTFATKGEWVAYTLAFFRKWRELRPTRATQWTLEGFQGGNFSPAQVAELVSRNIRFVVQFYGGAVEPLAHSPVLDLLVAGFPGDRIDGFYDSRVLPYKWRGFAFTQNTLP